MGDITSDLWITIGGATVSIATDEMLTDIEALRSISAALGPVSNQLAIADATLTDATRSMTQVGYARSAMDESWIAMTEAKKICDYVAGSMTIAIENYTETELNALWLALGVDSVISFVLGRSLKTYADMLGPVGAALGVLAPWFVRGKFEGDSEPIGAEDVAIDPALNALLSDPETVAAIRRFVMTGEYFADGLGEVPMVVSELFALMGASGSALSAGLLMTYARQAGMLSETGVTVKKANGYERPWAPITSTESRIDAIPVAANRPDGAQIRIDEIHDGNTVRYEVFIAGTGDFNPITRTDPFDLASNVAGVAGEPPASYRAVQLAMEQAGISASDAVSFVGYSQGGLIATMLAASGDYNAKGLTTIGAPAGQIIVPASVPALIIEHFEDAIPALGGTQANTNAVVVQRHAFSDQNPADPTLPMPGHQFQYYQETAQLIDNAESEKLQSTVDELNAFSAGDSVTSTWYHAERTD